MDVNNPNKTLEDIFSLVAVAAEEGGQDEEVQPQQPWSWRSPDGGFRMVKPIWQTILENLLPKKVMTMLILIIVVLKFAHYVTSMMDASTNLQQLVLYRSQFRFEKYSFVRVEEEDIDARQKTQSWYLTRPVIVNQLANVCILYMLFFAAEFTKVQLYSFGAGVGIWCLVNVVFNRWFLLFGKPNLAHTYQAKQWCLMNMHFFLSVIMICFFLMRVKELGASRYYSGPMHVVGLGMENQTTPCSSYKIYKAKNATLQNDQFSFSRDCRLQEYQAKVEVAWGGKWGCPALPTKHCQATVDYVRSEVGSVLPSMCGSGCKVVPIDLLRWDIYPCNKRVLDRTSPSRSKEVQDEIPSTTMSSQKGVCSLDEYSQDPVYQVKACLTKIFQTNFDRNDLTLKRSVQSIHSVKPVIGKEDALSGYIGDCNTCTIKRKKQRGVFSDPILLFAVSYALAMVCLAGWWILSMLEKHYGWCQTPENLVVRPVEGMEFWDFFFLTASFF